MQDYNLYSPLFSMGLSLCNSTPVRQIPCKSKSAASSFLALDVKRTVSVVDVNDEPEEIIDIELDVDDIQYIERKSRDYAYAYAAAPAYDPPSPSSSVRSTPSPSGRTLPLPKPAPVARLPAIPILTVSTTNSKYSASAAPSSSVLPPSSSYPPHSPSSSEVRRQRKFHSLAPSWMSGPFSSSAHHPYSPPTDVLSTDIRSLRTLSTTVSTNYKRKRRSDALAALEGRRRDGVTGHRHGVPSTGSAIGSSFVPSMVHEEDEEEEEEEIPLASAALMQIPFSSSAPSLIPSSTPASSTPGSTTPDTTASTPATSSASSTDEPLRSHLSLTSTVHTSAASSARNRPASRFRYDPSQVPQLPELPADLFVLQPPLPASAPSQAGNNSIRSPMSPTFPTSPRISTIAGEPPAPPVVGPARPVWFGRRASTGTTEIGWGMTFMELDDDNTTTPSNGSSSHKLSTIS